MKQSILGLLSFFLLPALVVGSESAREITGKVIETDGYEMRIATYSDRLPKRGDRVFLSYRLPKEGTIPLDGEWEIVHVEHNFVDAKPISSGYAQPAPGFQAMIFSDQPDVRETELGSYIRFADAYYQGLGVEKNYEKAAKWYKRAADFGNRYAKTTVGYLYLYGLGVKQDYAQARDYFEEAALLGSPSAMNNIGGLYEKGWGLKQDLNQAMNWYEQAAELGDECAQSNLERLVRDAPQS